jgi:hypothetical protein
MSCKHCKKFFQTLHRRCTIHINGECDCPICQGVCSCHLSTDLNQTDLLISGRTWGTESNGHEVTVIPPSRKFGERP